MKARLYLERINQEMINKKRTADVAKAIDRELARQKGDAMDWGGNVWDKSCCIINIGKRDPGMIDPMLRDFRKIGQFMLMRREAFGGLVWIKNTNAVYQVDEQAFMALNNLDNGLTIRKAAKSAAVAEAEVRALLRQLMTPVASRPSRI